MHILLARGGLNVMTLLGTFPSGIAQGMIWGIMALGVYITFRMLDIADLTVDGSFTTGGAVAVVLITSGVNCWLALAAATLAGLIAGLVTGILHTRLGIPAILSGILTQFALYSINLAIMGFSANRAVSVDRYALSISSRYINAALITGALIAVALVSVLYWYFGTEHGSAMRATGNNPDMSKALGININSMKLRGPSTKFETSIKLRKLVFPVFCSKQQDIFNIRLILKRKLDKTLPLFHIVLSRE